MVELGAALLHQLGIGGPGDRHLLEGAGAVAFEEADQLALVRLAGHDLLRLVGDEGLEGLDRGEVPARAARMAAFAGGLEAVEDGLVGGALLRRGAAVAPGPTAAAAAARGDEGYGDERTHRMLADHDQRPFRK
ncbi:MAG: hypothetical protein QM820_37140 [Minicystis sp.]